MALQNVLSVPPILSLRKDQQQQQGKKRVESLKQKTKSNKEVTFIVFDLGYVFISLEPTNQEKTLFTRQKAVKFAVGGCCCCCYSRWGSS